MAEPTKAPEPKVRTYDLKEAESQLLNIQQVSHQRSFAALLNHIVVERLGYPVTERTQFRVNPTFSEIEVSELPDDVPEAEAKTVTTPEPKSPGAVTA